MGMGYRFLVIATGGVILAAAVFGMVKRTTYTDITSREDYLEQLMVGEFPESLAEAAFGRLREVLPKAPVVLRVLVTGELEHKFGADRQQVQIVEVYAGEGPKGELAEGQEVYLYDQFWSTSQTTISRGFVNVMIPGTEYLVFAEGLMDELEGKLPVVRLVQDILVSPVFCCEEHTNIAVPVTGESTYVPYREVSGNEFFGTSQKTIAEWEALKEEMLALYGL